MRKLLFLVLTITASVAFASPPVQDEELPDPVVKVPVVENEQTVVHTQAEGPLVQDEIVADSVPLEPEEEQRVPVQDEELPDPVVKDEVVADSVLLEPETTEEQGVPEERQDILEKPVLVADYLTEEMPEMELIPIQMDRNIVPVEEAEAELQPETIEAEDEKEENVVMEQPTLEADYIMAEDPEIQMEPLRER